MRVLALISGGKDSFFNMMQCVAAGHDIVALGNLYPVGKDELDSFMFQTVGHQGIEFIGKAMALPLYREPTFGRSKMNGKNYTPTEDDEIEDLYRLLKNAKHSENIEAVSSGAIASDYQRLRVENVCARLGLTSLSYLWQQNQKDLLDQMINCNVNAIIIKVASLGLGPRHLGKSLSEMRSHLMKMEDKYGLNVCGEGGEYETFTLDCPLYIKSIVIDEYESIVQSEDDIAPVGYLNLMKIRLIDKNEEMKKWSLNERLRTVPMKQPNDYISNLILRAPGNHELDNASPDNNNPLKSSNRSHDVQELSDISIVKEEHCGWLWFGNIASENSNPRTAMEETIDKLQNHLKKENVELSDIVSVNLYIKDIAYYPLINEVYNSKFPKVNPPVRSCVECPLNVQVVLDALAYRNGSNARHNGAYERHTLHVQSISHWAPANVGPYSQAIRIGDIITVAGQIPLIPGNMTLLDSDIKQECRLTLRHISRILKLMDVNSQLGNIVQGICFLTDTSYVSEAREEWEKETKNAVVDYIVVSNLPRGAKVEYCVWAHRGNITFEYEETEAYVNNFQFTLKRRWKNKHDITAIVGQLSYGASDSSGNLVTGGSPSRTDLSMEVLLQCFEHLVRKMRDGSEFENLTWNLRIFYKAEAFSSPKLIENIYTYFLNHNVVITVIPATCLYNCNTLLSVCGTRYR